MTETLLKKLPAKMLIALNKGSVNTANLMSIVGTKHYNSIIRFLRQLEAEGLIESKRQGAKKFISLTEKGRNVAESVSKIDELMRTTAQ